MKRCCSPGANPYLTFHCASQGTILIDLAPDDKEYQSVEEEVCGLTSQSEQSVHSCNYWRSQRSFFHFHKWQKQFPIEALSSGTSE